MSIWSVAHFWEATSGEPGEGTIFGVVVRMTIRFEAQRDVIAGGTDVLLVVVFGMVLLMPTFVSFEVVLTIS